MTCSFLWEYVGIIEKQQKRLVFRHLEHEKRIVERHAFLCLSTREGKTPIKKLVSQRFEIELVNHELLNVDDFWSRNVGQHMAKNHQQTR